MIKKVSFGFVVFFMLSSIGYAKADNKVAAAPLDKIIAVVNGDVITQSELDQRIALIARQLARNNAAELKGSALRVKALDSLIYTLLQMQLAQRNGIQVSEAELDNVVANVAKNNHLTVEQLKKSLQEQEGLGFKEYREQIREQVLISRVEQQFLGKEIVVSEQEVAKVLRNPPKIDSDAAVRYHVADVLVETPDGASLEQIKTATSVAMQIAVKLKQGVDIEQIMQEYNAKGQQVRNNDLGWRKVDELPALFAKEVTQIKVGQITDVIKAPNGLHLVRLLEVQGVQPQDMKFTKAQAQEMVFHQKLEEKLKPWLKELRDAAYVKIIN